jgi:hypothetical protein
MRLAKWSRRTTTQISKSGQDEQIFVILYETFARFFLGLMVATHGTEDPI